MYVQSMYMKCITNLILDLAIQQSPRCSWYKVVELPFINIWFAGVWEVPGYTVTNGDCAAMNLRTVSTLTLKLCISECDKDASCVAISTIALLRVVVTCGLEKTDCTSLLMKTTMAYRYYRKGKLYQRRGETLPMKQISLFLMLELSNLVHRCILV
jgi:hypothetical protein